MSRPRKRPSSHGYSDKISRGQREKTRFEAARRRRCSKYIRLSQSATIKAAFCDSAPGSCSMSGGQLKLTGRWEEQGSGACVPTAQSTMSYNFGVAGTVQACMYVCTYIHMYIHIVSYSKWRPIKSATPTPIRNYIVLVLVLV